LAPVCRARCNRHKKLAPESGVYSILWRGQIIAYHKRMHLVNALILEPVSGECVRG